MRRIYLLLSLVLIILLNTAFYFGDVKTVTGTCLKKTEYSEEVNVTGEFENIKTTQIKFSYPVFIKEIYVKENDCVNFGQALFSLDTDRMQSVMSGELTEEMLGNISFSDIDSVKEYSAVMQYTDISPVIYAPSDGIITDVNVYDGAFIMKNNNIISISDNSTILAKFTLSQSDFGRVEVGDSVDIVPVAFSDRKYSGKIIDKNAVVKKQVSVTGSKVMIDIYASIDNPDKYISDGLQINGKIYDSIIAKKLMLPYKYIYQDTDGEYVYILQGDKAMKTYIETGTENNALTEIITEFDDDTIFLSGEIENGDRVIVRGMADESV